jgi:hypothetical protein
MRFIHVYLIAYFVLVLGAAAVLWEAGVLARIPGIWLTVAAIVVVGLGLVLAITSVRTPRLRS